MTAARETPYEALIMDHIRNARNYRVLEDANRRAAGVNPMCGDDLKLQLRVERGRIEDIGFQCECCGISMASASMMTERVKGRDLAAVRAEIRAVTERLAAASGTVPEGDDPGQHALAATVREFPARKRCAVLPWTTLEAALAGGPE
jgi:nitrogen fixation NifU-like protein